MGRRAAPWRASESASESAGRQQPPSTPCPRPSPGRPLGRPLGHPRRPLGRPSPSLPAASVPVLVPVAVSVAVPVVVPAVIPVVIPALVPAIPSVAITEDAGGRRSASRPGSRPRVTAGVRRGRRPVRASRSRSPRRPPDGSSRRSWPRSSPCPSGAFLRAGASPRAGRACTLSSLIGRPATCSVPRLASTNARAASSRVKGPRHVDVAARSGLRAYASGGRGRLVGDSGRKDSEKSIIHGDSLYHSVEIDLGGAARLDQCAVEDLIAKEFNLRIWLPAWPRWK